ncbi:hypothetical protein M9Y10_016427 [Tritrichomonas musculus]|uniref:Protein kinase domain-containing protein n=1 Tax=Tritrichomonas musculus TaxID=1915356 RepID=A0ABR2HW57_9EUKA
MDFSKSLRLKRSIEDFIIKESIGRGQYGSVFRCIEKRNGKEFAIKLLEPCNDNAEQYKNFTREVTIQSQVVHPAIIPLHCFGENCHTEIGTVDYIMSPLMKNGSLDTYINPESIEKLSPTNKMIIIYGTAAGMNFLHKRNVIHRDLKPANILLDEFYRPYITDFGFSKFTPNGSRATFSIRPGTPLYLAPELLEDDDENLSNKVDVYAFGIIVFNVLTGLQFSELNTMFKLCKYVTEGGRPDIPPTVDEKYKDLIEKCWSGSPHDRPSFDEIVSVLEEEENLLPGVNKHSFEKYKQFVNAPLETEEEKNEKDADTDVDIGADTDFYPKTAPTGRINYDLPFRGFRPIDLSKSTNLSKFIFFHFLFDKEHIHINLGSNITVADAKIVISIEKNIPPSYLKLMFNGAECKEKCKLTDYKSPDQPIIITTVKDVSELPNDKDDREELVEEEIHSQVNAKTTQLILRELNRMTGLQPLDVFHNFFVCGKSMKLFRDCSELCKNKGV